MKILKFATLAAIVLLTGCSVTGKGDGPAPTPNTGKLGMTGGLAGYTVGKSLSEADRRLALQAEYKALEHTQSGRPVSWKSAKGDPSGDVVAAQPYRVGSQDCRQYSHTVFDDGATQTARGTACRNADGTWTPLT
jgi:surface antigen